MDTLLLSVLGDDRQAALMSADRLSRVAFSPPGTGLAAGDVCLGRVLARDRRLAACFVDVGAPRPGLLMFADLAEPAQPPAAGDRLICRVLRAAEAGKGVKLACRPPVAAALVERARTLTPPVRLAAAPAAVDRLLAGIDPARLRSAFVDDGPALATLKAAWPALADRCRLDTGPAPLFARHGVEAAIDAALAAEVALPSGGRLAIRETPAAVTIDVDLGAAGAGDGDGRPALAATNREAMAAIAWLVGLRDLAGHIVIDPLATRNRRLRAELLAALAAGLSAADACDGPPRIVHIGGFTALGLIELTRERRGPSLAALLTRPCGACDGGREPAPWLVAGAALRHLVAWARCNPGRFPRLAAPAAVAEALAGEMAGVRDAAAARLGGAVIVVVDGSLAAGTFRIEPAPKP